MIREEQAFDSRGQVWTIFFGVAAVFIGLLVLVSRILAEIDDGGTPATRAAIAAAVVEAVPASHARAPYKPLELPDAGSYDSPLDMEAAAPAEEAAGSEGGPALREEPTATAPVAPPPPEAASPPEPQAAPAAPAPPGVQPPQVTAKSFAIVERSCGALVSGKNESQRLPPASLTKIITAMVVAERANLDTMVDIQDISAKSLIKTTDSSVMGIEPGMRFSVRDLLYGLLLPSGNDAALALAGLVGGGVPGFVALMNNKAQGIGLTDTHFTNPHGLDEPGLFSSALDMARAGRALLGNQLLAAMSVEPQYETPGEVRILMKNGNQLLRTYPGAFGVKIGFTTYADQTIVAAARRNGRELVLSVLGSEDRYGDSTALFDWAFANSQPACR